jgi:Fe-S cluster biosynthesis and repair protein YggX
MAPDPTGTPAPPAAWMTTPCTRCGGEGEEFPALPRPPMPGALGREIQARVCAFCWQDWTKTEVMVINELKLNFMDPGSQAALDREMRDFLRMPEAGAAPAAPGEPGAPPRG